MSLLTRVGRGVMSVSFLFRVVGCLLLIAGKKGKTHHAAKGKGRRGEVRDLRPVTRSLLSPRRPSLFALRPLCRLLVSAC